MSKEICSNCGNETIYCFCSGYGAEELQYEEERRARLGLTKKKFYSINPNDIDYDLNEQELNQCIKDFPQASNQEQAQNIVNRMQDNIDKFKEFANNNMRY